MQAVQMAHTKSSKSLRASFVAYEFAWGRILNKCAVISPDKQKNDRKMSDCFVFVS